MDRWYFKKAVVVFIASAAVLVCSPGIAAVKGLNDSQIVAEMAGARPPEAWLKASEKVIPSPPGFTGRIPIRSEEVTNVPSPDVEALLADRIDSGNPSTNKPELIAFHVGVPAIPLGTWTPISGVDGRTVSWRLLLRSSGAVSLRPHFQNIPMGGHLFIYGSPIEGEVHFVPRNVTSAGGGTWGRTVGGTEFFLEWISDGNEPPFGLVVDKVSYGFRDAITDVDDRVTKVSWCYEDVTCYSAWNNAKTGVARFRYESNGTGYVCTGSILMDLGSSFRNWFYTANHCIGNSTEASSMEVFWNYHTGTCDGSPPSLYSLPTSNGATLLCEGELIDYSLVELWEDPPASSYYLGWTTAAWSDNDPVTVIHHPDGSYKRISFGNIVGTLGNKVDVEYSLSSTEGGSSGAPLFDSEQRVRGDLSGGLASCDQMSWNDHYGKFSSAYSDCIDTFLWVNSIDIALKYLRTTQSIEVSWTADVETDNAGWNVYRSPGKYEAFQRINDAIIAPYRYDYLYEDVNVERHGYFCYKIEDVDTNGETTMHGPMCVGTFDLPEQKPAVNIH